MNYFKWFLVVIAAAALIGMAFAYGPGAVIMLAIFDAALYFALKQFGMVE
jgi:hypothetical protein